MVTALLGAAVLALGTWGFAVQGGGPSTDAALATGQVTGTTRLYLALQLFVLESGGVQGPVPWQLELARVAAPAVAAYAVVQAGLALLRERVDRWRTGRARDHVVVVGLGACGALLCRRLLDQGRRVVGVDRELGDGAAELRDAGALLLVADARRPETLRRAGLRRAAHLVVLCGDDETTTEVLALARELGAERGPLPPLRAVGALSSPELWALLTVRELADGEDSRVRVELLDPEAAGALTVAGTLPPGQDGQAPPVVLVGQGRLTGQVLLALARTWGHPASGGPLRAALVGMPAAELAELVRQHPELRQLAQTALHDDVRAAWRSTVPAARHAYVCEQDSAVAVRRTVEVACAAGPDGHVVVVQRSSSAVARLLAAAAPAPARVTCAGLLDEACRPEVLLSGTTELLAQALHRMYLESRASESTTSTDDPALRPWECLPEPLRESNRAHARDVAVKLRSVGRSVSLLTDWDAALGALSGEEVERLAVLEHERWVRERRAAGWTPGPRDAQRRTTPHLVGWDELDEQVRDADRLFVRQLPRLLASVGLQVLPRT